MNAPILTSNLVIGGAVGFLSAGRLPAALVAQLGGAAQAAELLTGAGDAGIIKLLTESVVGACLIGAVVLFLRRDRERDVEATKRDASRDAIIKEIADDFREDVRSIVQRLEANQGSLVDLNREVVTAVAALNHTVATLDMGVRSLADRQTKLEHHVLVLQPMPERGLRAESLHVQQGQSERTTAPPPEG